MYSQTPPPPSGVTATSNFDYGVIDMFPRVNKKYLVEAAVERSFNRDFQSANASVFDGRVNDSFIEFIIPASDNELIDLASLSAEIKIEITAADGTAVDNTCNITLVDGFFHRIFKSHSIFLNGVQVEGNNNFGLTNVVKTYMGMNRNKLDSAGRLMMYKCLDTPTPPIILPAYFTTPTASERSIIASARTGIHMMGPLHFDISNADAYMLDGVEVRIRLDLANPSVVLLTSDAAEYVYRVTMCKLWCKKIVPIPSAMVALHKSMEDNSLMEYMIQRPLVKSIIFPADQTNLCIDSPFNGIVPHRIVAFVLDQGAYNGVYNRNPNYFSHINISELSVNINGNSHVCLKSTFPNQIANTFYHTLQNIGDSDHLLTYNNFPTGRALFVFDTRPTDSTDTLTIEKNANVRFTLTSSAASLANKIVFLIGFTIGTIQINSNRRVFPNYLQ